MIDEVSPQQGSLVEYLPELEEVLNEESLPILVFYRRVKSEITEVEQREVSSEDKRRAVIDVINKVLRSAHIIKDFDDLDLNLNRRMWITELLSLYPDVDIKDAQFLLNDFTYEMKSRMREEEKYGILLLAPGLLILCHSKFGEITITPDFKILPRMLDTDNVIRFVAFIRNENGKIQVKYHEEYKTKFLVEWLGISKREAYSYLGGRYRLEGDVNGIKISLELLPDEFYKLLKGHIDGINLQDGRIVFEHPIEGLPITLARAGKKPYKDLEEFVQDFMLEYFTVDKIKEKYKQVLGSVYVSMGSFKVFDDKEEVLVMSSGRLVEKIPKAFDVMIPIFGTKGKIEIRESFLRNMATKLVNGEKIRVFHPGDDFSPEPIAVDSLEIYNKLHTSDALKKVLEAVNQSETGKSYIDRLLMYSALKLLITENMDKKISFFLEKLSSKILSIIQVPKSKIMLLRKEDVLVEYKSREYLEGKNEEIINKISEDLVSKFKSRVIVIYYFGFDEKTRVFDGINLSRINDDRLRKWEEGVRNKVGASRVYFYDVPHQESKRKGIVIMVAIK